MPPYSSLISDSSDFSDAMERTLTTAPAAEMPSRGRAAATPVTSRTQFSARVISPDCYSVAIFGSGGNYAGFSEN
jgi:hypothetical protein